MSSDRGNITKTTNSIVQKDTANTSLLQPAVFISSTPNPYHILAVDIYSLRAAGQLPKLPHISQDEINDKSKANPFIKAIAVTQILWMVVQILVRTGRKLAVTQLEISVSAFLASAIIIYWLNWKKPKDVKTPYTLLPFPRELPVETLGVINEGNSTHSASDFATDLFSYIRGEISYGVPIPNDYTKDCEADFFLGLCFGCTIFGAIHIAAWNFDFPTKLELILRRTTSIWCTVYSLSIIFLGFFVSLVSEYYTIDREWWLVVGMHLTTALYVTGRLILLVEIFRTLLFLPPDAFRVISASNVPHVS